MTTQLSNLTNYARALLYCDFKRNHYRIVCLTDMTIVTSAVLFRSESKGSGFYANERL